MRTASADRVGGSAAFPAFLVGNALRIAASASALVEHQRQSGGKRGSSMRARARSPIKEDHRSEAPLQVWRVDGSGPLGAHGFDGLVSPIRPERFLVTDNSVRHVEGVNIPAGRGEDRRRESAALPASSLRSTPQCEKTNWKRMRKPCALRALRAFVMSATADVAVGAPFLSCAMRD
jgi:hypothetical protein